MESLVAANIRSRPTRTLISIVAVGFGVILMVIIGGIASGTLNDYLDRNLSLGADFIFQPTGASIFYGLTEAALNQRIAAKLLEIPGVGSVTPVLAKFSPARFGLVFGIDLETYNTFPGRLRLAEGRFWTGGREAIVDEVFARSRGLRTGDTLEILNQEFQLSGICRSGAVVRVFVPLETLQQMNASPEKVSLMFIKAEEGADQEAVLTRLRNRFPGYSLVLAADKTSLLAGTYIPAIREFKITVVFVSMVLSFLVIMLAMYSTIFERTREIGILKSLGATRGFILALILKESVIICFLGVLFGIGASALIRAAVLSVFPTLQVAMSWQDIASASLLGLMGGTLGALYPAYRASKQDPVESMSYE